MDRVGDHISIPNHDSSMFVVVSGRHGTLPFHSIGPEVGFQQVIYKPGPTSRNYRRWRLVPDRWLPPFIISPLTALMLIGTAYPGLTSILFCHFDVGVLQPLVLCDRLGYFKANISTMERRGGNVVDGDESSKEREPLKLGNRLFLEEPLDLYPRHSAPLAGI